MRIVKVNGLDFAVDTRGTGESLQFVRGTNADMRQGPSPLDSLLTKHFAVTIFDQRGMGLGPKPAGPYTMLDYARDAIGILDALDINQTHLVGYSFGGMVAQEMAIRYPHRIKALVLAATTAGGEGGSSFPLHELLSLAPPARAKRELEIGDLRFTPQWQTDHPDEASARIQQRIDRQGEFIDEPGNREGRLLQLEARARHNTWDRLHKIKSPTLVLCGEYDGQAPSVASHNMATRIVNNNLKTVPGGHGFINDNEVAFQAIADHCATYQGNP